VEEMRVKGFEKAIKTGALLRGLKIEFQRDPLRSIDGFGTSGRSLGLPE